MEDEPRDSWRRNILSIITRVRPRFRELADRKEIWVKWGSCCWDPGKSHILRRERRSSTRQSATTHKVNLGETPSSRLRTCSMGRSKISGRHLHTDPQRGRGRPDEWRAEPKLRVVRNAQIVGQRYRPYKTVEGSDRPSFHLPPQLLCVQLATPASARKVLTLTKSGIAAIRRIRNTNESCCCNLPLMAHARFPLRLCFGPCVCRLRGRVSASFLIVCFLGCGPGASSVAHSLSKCRQDVSPQRGRGTLVSKLPC